MPAKDVFKLAFQILVALVGVLGNALVVVVLSRVGKKKRPGDFYLQNLAIADIGTLLLAFPIVSIKEKSRLNWPFGEVGCRYLSLVPEIFYGASVWFIAVIAIERYRKVVALNIPGQGQNKKLRRAKTLAGCVWATSFLIFSLPVYFFVKYRELSNGVKWCGPVWPLWDHNFVLARVYTVSLSLFSYLFPLIVISFCYLAISRTIRRSSIFNKAMKYEQYGITEGKSVASMVKVKSIRLRQNKRAKKILTPLVLVFAMTMLPLNIFRLTIAFWPAIAMKECYNNLLFVVSVLVIINSSANPVIYTIVSKDLRKQIKNLCL